MKIKILIVLLCGILLGVLPAQAEDSMSDRYSVKPLVSLIVSGENTNLAVEALQKAITLSKNVKVVNVLLVLSAEKSAKISSALSDEGNDVQSVVLSGDELVYKQALDSLRVTNTEVSVQSSIFRRLRLSYSPTWVVRYEGKDYVFEGFQDISKYFTADGNFNY